jgi:hypothetical protein
VLYPHSLHARAYTYIYFEENQISLSLISLLLLSTSHPRTSQGSPVRSSTRCYPRFNLLMDRSLSFGSTANYSIALFRLAFAPPPDLRSLGLQLTVSRWVIMQKARRQTDLAVIVLRLLVSAGFQGLFHSPPGVLFSVRSRYSFAIGLSGVFSLRVWSP